MREILFRGKIINLNSDADGRWVIGHMVARSIHDNENDKYFICEIGHLFIRCLNKMPCTHEVAPETVGQYTGLTDKNGKRIFEGDIIKIPDDYDTYGMNAGEVYEVYFGFGGFRLKPKYRKNARGYFLEDSGEVEVIGNIHDNPELIAEVYG